MGWKTIYGRRYYYKSRRVGGRVESTYYGAGELGSVFAELDAAERWLKAAKREREQAERRESDAEDQTVAEWFDEVQSLADAVMAEAGFHKHRGQWRRKRS